MRPFKDQHGNVVTADELIASVAEAILANVMAFVESGFLVSSLKMVVGKDGGTVFVDGLVLQTPIENPLNEDMAKRLFQTFSDLLEDFEKGRMDDDRLFAIRERHRVANKVQAIAQAQGKGSFQA